MTVEEVDPELRRLLILELSRHLVTLQGTDAEAARRAVHAMKGSAGLAGERELAEAMEPFRQFATTLRPGGSGLGLSLTKALVKANHANLSIASNANDGTLVEVVFPRARVMAV